MFFKRSSSKKFIAKDFSEMNYCELMEYLNASNHLGGKKTTRTLMDLIMKTHDKKIVLDAGCGNGKTISYIAKRYKNYQMVGLDISNSFLKLAKSKSSNIKNRVDYVKADVSLLPFTDESFDLVISEDVIPFVKNKEKALSELRRVLKKDGYIAISMSFCLTQPDESFLKNLYKMYKLDVGPVVLPEFREILKKVGLRETKFVKPKLTLLGTLDFSLVLKIFFLSIFNSSIRKRFIYHLCTWRKVLHNTSETVGFGIFVLRKIN